MAGVRMTEEELNAYQERRKQPPAATATTSNEAPRVKKRGGWDGRVNPYFRAVAPKQKGRSKTQIAFEEEFLKPRGNLYGEEQIKFRLAKKCWYTPDYWELLPDGRMIFWEIKGTFKFMPDDAKVKFKTAAERFSMYIWCMAAPKSKKPGGGWEVQEYGYRNDETRQPI